MAENGNTTRTQLINLEGLSTFLDESKKIFEPTLPAGTNGQVLKLSGGKKTWGGLTPADVGAVASSEKGSASGVATLDSNKKLIETQVPPYVSTKVVNLTGTIPTYKIGSTGPGGGIVFYDAGKTITSKYLDASGEEVSYNWRYLEVSPRLTATMPNGSTASTHPWGINWDSSRGWLWGDSAVEGLKSEIGTGRYNTTKAVNQLGADFNSHYYSSSMSADLVTGPGNYAPCICYNYRGGGFSDWYLPSIQELVKIYTNARVPGYISENSWCWSSSIYSSNDCWYLSFSVPFVTTDGRYGRRCVRAVRGFLP